MHREKRKQGLHYYTDPCTAVIIGAPTYEGKLFPPMNQVLEMAVLKRIQNKKVAYFGSYGWSGGALKQTKEIIESVKWDWIDTMEFNGGVTGERLKEAEAFGSNFAEKAVQKKNSRKTLSEKLDESKRIQSEQG